ncbi:hypothetical protein Tco_0708767, partial [Tanacetum coccineum]
NLDYNIMPSFLLCLQFIAAKCLIVEAFTILLYDRVAPVTVLISLGEFGVGDEWDVGIGLKLSSGAVGLDIYKTT